MGQTIRPDGTGPTAAIGGCIGPANMGGRITRESGYRGGPIPPPIGSAGPFPAGLVAGPPTNGVTFEINSRRASRPSPLASVCGSVQTRRSSRRHRRGAPTIRAIRQLRLLRMELKIMTAVKTMEETAASTQAVPGWQDSIRSSQRFRNQPSKSAPWAGRFYGPPTEERGTCTRNGPIGGRHLERNFCHVDD